jgi:hypothetical protein
VDKIVTFEIDGDSDERRAHNVVFEREVAARRARMRGGSRGARS